ncbi:MAG: EipB family protein [Alphaproteobacteria bacterium]
MGLRNLFVTALFVGMFFPPASAAEPETPPSPREAPSRNASVPLASHQAVYVLSLASVRSGSGILGVSGRMTYRFADTCDGWAIESHSTMDISEDQGESLATGWDFTAWESYDGLRYRFHVRTTQDGSVAESIDGSARLENEGGKGEASFVAPHVAVVPLPPGTMFPTRHTRALISSAASGEKFLSHHVFDGSVLGPPFLISAILGATLPPSAPTEMDNPLLTSRPSWRMGLAYFKTDDDGEADPTPYHEMRVRYHDNAVAERVFQDYGPFRLEARLKELQVLPRPDC